MPAGSIDDIRTAALLFNVKELGVNDDVLCRAAQVSQEELCQGISEKTRGLGKPGVKASPLHRSIVVFVAARQLRQRGERPQTASPEVQVLMLAEDYDNVTSAQGSSKLSPIQAGQEVIRRAGNRFDTAILEAFSKSFGVQAAGAGA